MSTRADFYVGRNVNMVWHGSIAQDGDVFGIPMSILTAQTQNEYLEELNKFLSRRVDGTKPEQGWPWIWDNSGITDYTYSFDDGCVYISNYGSQWFKVPAGITDIDTLCNLFDHRANKDFTFKSGFKDMSGFKKRDYTN